MSRIAFFDLDGTITGGLQVEYAFAWYLLTHGHIGLKQMIAFIKFLFKWGWRFKKHVFIKDKAYLAGLLVSDIESIAEKFTKEKLLQRIRPRIQKLIEKHQAQGDKVILLTATYDFIARHFASHLNMDGHEAAIMPTKKSRFSDALLLQHPFGPTKFVIAKKVCGQLNISLQDCYAYGNSYNDRFVLDGVGHAIAVTPDRKLRQLAKDKGWEIVG